MVFEASTPYAITIWVSVNEEDSRTKTEHWDTPILKDHREEEASANKIVKK